jgi:hypothetical protein
MPDQQTAAAAPSPTPLEVRSLVQAMLAQLHGVLAYCGMHVDQWIWASLDDDPDDDLDMKDKVVRALAEIDAQFGVINAALNTGLLDERLVNAGFGGAQGVMKRDGFLARIRKWMSLGLSDRRWIAGLRGCCRWGETFVGSVGTAVSDEVAKLPGASAAVEVVKEILQVIGHLTEPGDRGSAAPARTGK